VQIDRDQSSSALPLNDQKQSREWDSSEYHRLSQPQVSWGEKVLSRLKLRGDECVLDAGCGSGRLTAELTEALPRGQVVGVDLSKNMVQAAREHLRSDFGRRVGLVAADLVDLPFEHAFDGIVSTAAFHWVLDHNKLFASLRSTLREGGWLHAQCGGGPNLARLRRRVAELAEFPRYAPYLAEFPEPWFFADARQAGDILQRAGFVNVATSVEPAPTVLEDAEQYAGFISGIILRVHLGELPSGDLRSQFVAELTEMAGEDTHPYSLDYWRLNLSADTP
jgi:trans-aconitate 2-methyltransferase